MDKTYYLIDFSLKDFDPSIKESFLINKPWDITYREWLSHPSNPYSLNETGKKLVDLIEREGQKYPKGTFLTRKNIAKRLGVSLRTIQLHLTKLRVLGIIYTFRHTFSDGSTFLKSINRYKLNPRFACLQSRNYWLASTDTILNIMTVDSNRSIKVTNLTPTTISSKLLVNLDIAQAKKLKNRKV